MKRIKRIILISFLLGIAIVMDILFFIWKKIKGITFFPGA